MQVVPRIVHSVGAQKIPRPAVEPVGFSADSLNIVRQGMYGAANEPGGTAFPWRITNPDIAMAGKTGTAQVRVITKEERLTGVIANEKLPWNLRDHALYIGFAPVDRPRYACAVVMEHGAVDPHPHVQIARDALIFAQQKDILGRATAYPQTTARL